MVHQKYALGGTYSIRWISREYSWYTCALYYNYIHRCEINIMQLYKHASIQATL